MIPPLQVKNSFRIATQLANCTGKNKCLSEAKIIPH